MNIRTLKVGDEVRNLPPGGKRSTRWRVVAITWWARGARAAVMLKLLSRWRARMELEVRHPRRVRWSRKDRTMRLARSELSAPWWSHG